MTDRPTWSYLPALDGVRALAVVSVVLFHVWPDAFPGGFVGVDLFFVLSGYLITAMALVEHERTGRLDLRAFWSRRVHRLVPAVLVVVAATSVAAAALGTASARGLADSVGALTWSTNWLELYLSGQPWWAVDTRTLLDHLWSLAVEEQFYLVWPLVLAGLMRRARSKRTWFAVLAGLIVASAAVSAWAGYPAAYFRTDARAFELVAGAALAVLGRRPGPRLAGGLVAGSVAALAVVVAVVHSTESALYPWGLLGITALAVALVAGATDPPGWVSAVLAGGAVRHLGQVSYGVYLWHIPVVRVLHPGRVPLDGVGLLVLRLVVLAVLVEASWRLVERPLRTGGPASRAPFVALAVVSVASLLLLVPGARRAVDRRWEVADNRPPPSVAPGERRVLVVGDLVGGIVGDGIGSTEGLAVWNTADLGCPLGPAGRFDPGDGPVEAPEFCRRWPERWSAASGRFRADAVVVASGVWDTLAWTDDDGRRLDDAALDRRFAELAARQVEVASTRGGDGPAGGLVPVVLVVVEDPTGLAPPDQPRDAARRDRARRYAAALRDAAAGRREVSVVEVEGAPDFPDLRSFAAEAVATRVVEVTGAVRPR